jgi:hypothetical protein
MRLHRPRRRRSFQDEMDHPWYHDFAALGVPTHQAEGIFGPNQQAKQAALFDYINRAIELSGPEPDGLELFCADGYYSHYALQHGARHMIGVDLGDPQSAGDPMHLRQADAMTSLLGHDGRAEFRRQDAFDVSGRYDFAICAGGLYHLAQPEKLLGKLTDNVRVALVVQTVCSLAQTAADYFETPAPGQDWGCRFSYDRLLSMLADAGWNVVASSTNELDGNARPEDRGSAYVLCVAGGTT